MGPACTIATNILKKKTSSPSAPSWLLIQLTHQIRQHTTNQYGSVRRPIKSHQLYPKRHSRSSNLSCQHSFLTTPTSPKSTMIFSKPTMKALHMSKQL